MRLNGKMLLTAFAQRRAPDPGFGGRGVARVVLWGAVMLVPVASLGRGIHVQWVDLYGNGTMMASLADGEGRVTHVCLDGRADSPTRGRLFEQARHPRQEGAALVELGGPEEAVVVPLVSRWLESGPRATGLTERGWELARATLLLVGAFS